MSSKTSENSRLEKSSDQDLGSSSHFESNQGSATIMDRSSNTNFEQSRRSTNITSGTLTDSSRGQSKTSDQNKSFERRPVRGEMYHFDKTRDSTKTREISTQSGKNYQESDISDNNRSSTPEPSRAHSSNFASFEPNFESTKIPTSSNFENNQTSEISDIEIDSNGPSDGLSDVILEDLDDEESDDPSATFRMKKN